MSEATISFADQDQVRTLLGTHDRFLRQVRDSVGIDIVLRGDQLKLQGDHEAIERGLEVFRELQAIVEKTGRLREAEVRRVLAGEPVLPAGPVGPVGEADDLSATPAGRNGSSGPTIELYEKGKRIEPRTPGQIGYVETMRNNDLVFCAGPAGSGKTFLAVAMAINALRQEQVRKIVLVRPAVEAGEKLGFLPGDMLAKVNPYLRPLLDALNDMLDFEQVKLYMERDVIEIIPLAFMRGRTLNHTFMILDEGQNTTVTQMKMFLTRMGVGSKIVVTGDTTQLDLADSVTSGLTDAIRRLGHIERVGTVRLTGRDIVRHRLVREMVRAYDRPAQQRETPSP